MKSPFETEERRAFRDTIRNFVETEISPFAHEWDEAGAVPWALHEKLGELGIFGFGIDEEYGGLGFDCPFMRCIVGEEMAKCGFGGVGAAVGGRGISLDPIQRLAAPEIRDRVLKDIVLGKKAPALALPSQAVVQMSRALKQQRRGMVIILFSMAQRHSLRAAWSRIILLLVPEPAGPA